MCPDYLRVGNFSGKVGRLIDATIVLIKNFDENVGISESDKNSIFKKGFGKHTGLGLYLSREILEISCLTIEETGTPGKGARFEITVPKGRYRVVRGSGV